MTTIPEVGDIVQLNSGGPAMTVLRHPYPKEQVNFVESDPMRQSVFCIGVSRDRGLWTERIPISALMLAAEPAKDS